jgi:hypothetical protein
LSNIKERTVGVTVAARWEHTYDAKVVWLVYVAARLSHPKEVAELIEQAVAKAERR